MTTTEQTLCDVIERLANAYDELLAAHGKPYGWGLIETESARAVVGQVMFPNIVPCDCF